MLFYYLQGCHGRTVAEVLLHHGTTPANRDRRDIPETHDFSRGELSNKPYPKETDSSVSYT
jgi:hypothetical protein